MRPPGRVCAEWLRCLVQARIARRRSEPGSAGRDKLGLDMPPTLGNGKICYIQIPAIDIARSADFYHRVFGWNIRQRAHGTAFDDGAGEGSGEWVVDSAPAIQRRWLIYFSGDRWV